MEKAARYLKEEPVTVTASQCERSAGGKLDFVFYARRDMWRPLYDSVKAAAEEHPENRAYSTAAALIERTVEGRE